MSARGGVRPTPALLLYLGGLGCGVAVVAIAAASARHPVEAVSPAALAFLTGLLIAAEYLFVRFRFGGEINALNLVEAVLAPLLFAFEASVVMVVVAIAQVVGGALRRNAPIKAAFNVVQWTLAAGLGALLFAGLAPSAGVSWGSIGALVASLALVGVVNQLSFTGVLSIVERRPVRAVLGSLVPIAPGWAAGWTINVLTGLLFVLALEAHPAAVVLFPVPLVMLHLAYRGYAGARSDRVRLAGLPRAAQLLTDPLDPMDAVVPFLREVARCFEARAASLVVRSGDRRVIYRVRGDEPPELREEDAGAPTLEGALLAHPSARRTSAWSDDPLAEQLDAAGWRDCLSAPLLEGGSIAGALLVFDQAGLEGFESGELAVIESLARETASSLAKGRLVAEILTERRRLGQIVSSASDGIFTIDAGGVIRSWNPAMERIAGIDAHDIVGRATGIASLQIRGRDGEPVRLDSWPGERLPAELHMTGADGIERLLSCTYSRAHDAEEDRTSLIVVARDLTPEQEIAELRLRFEELVRAEAAQRLVVERLQDAMMPTAPTVDGLELGVSYLPSDPTAPTGGDLFDWQVLPSGEVHVAVVDVLGHGVTATKDALTAVHALRTLALQDCPLEQLVARADALLASQNPSLVATTVIVRYDPATSRARVAGGGHPPALLVRAGGACEQVVAPGGAIGWPGAGSNGAAEVVLGPGDSLVLYTDGLVEAGKDIIAGEEALQRHAAGLAGSDAGELADGLLSRALADGARRDDSLALVIRREPSEVTRVWEIAPDQRRASLVRREAAAWLASRGATGDELDDLQLVCAELLSNACAAARERIVLRLLKDGDVVSIEVQDDGAGDPHLGSLGADLPSDDEGTGRGLFIVRSVADDVTAISGEEGSIIRVTKRIATGDEATRSEDRSQYMRPT